VPQPPATLADRRIPFPAGLGRLGPDGIHTDWYILLQLG
jgi:hypothetical protein